MKESARTSQGPDDAKGVGMHSSPVMTDDKEAKPKGKEAKQAVAKIEAKANPPAKE